MDLGKNLELPEPKSLENGFRTTTYMSEKGTLLSLDLRGETSWSFFEEVMSCWRREMVVEVPKDAEG